VAEPAELPALVARLAEFSAAFDDAREWRYGLFDATTGDVVGELSLFPRNEKGRVAFDVADHIEIGYWVRADACGRGLATEATQAVIALALGLPDIDRLTIHCDERNVASAAIPRRLGFRLADSPEPSGIQVWSLHVLSGRTVEQQSVTDPASYPR
jgi:RimJ/RimL family protein N-acetyltransferase